MLGLKLNHVSKRGHWWHWGNIRLWWLQWQWRLKKLYVTAMRYILSSLISNAATLIYGCTISFFYHSWIATKIILAPVAFLPLFSNESHSVSIPVTWGIENKTGPYGHHCLYTKLWTRHKTACKDPIPQDLCAVLNKDKWIKFVNRNIWTV